MKETGKMKTLRYILLSVAVASLASACSDDLNPDGPANKAEKGDEVQFAVSLPGSPDSRTIYGEDSGTGFPIYWVPGDKVWVASAECLSGRNVAEYAINSNSSDNLNHAETITKTGEYGVQWGDAETATFYSIYPAANNELNTDNSVKATFTIANSQTCTPKTNNATDLVYEPFDMGNVVMYAKTTGVKKGETVNLKYVPYSTVIDFVVNGPDMSGTASWADSIVVQTLKLQAPEGTNLAGSFEMDFTSADDTYITSNITNYPTVNVTGGSNEVLIHLTNQNGSYATLKKNQTLHVKVCLIPVEHANLNGWKVTLSTITGNYTRNLDNSSMASPKLEPGKIHTVNLPNLNYKGEWNPDMTKWVTELPDYTNIYLSEISLPGAWYAGSDEAYQATSNITTLWNAGVRAFAVECRTNSTYTSWHWTPNYVCISGSGRNTSIGTDAYTNGKNITDVLDAIRTALASHKDEYAVLVLSYADGGSGGHRAEDHAYFLQGVANALSKYDIVYRGPITKDTTIDQVKGKLIVKVNVDNNITKGDYTGMNALISYNPFLSQMNNADYARPYYSDLHWSDWADSYKSYGLVANLQRATGNDNRFVWVFSSANRTQTDTGTNTTIPTYAQRKAALAAMGDYSKAIYDASTHNVWFYFNCGGSQATSSTSDKPSPTDFASNMNSWLLDRINAKTDASPLGIVMFNQCTGDNNTYHGADIIKAIVMMNSKFYLKHAGTSEGSNTGTNTAQNDGTVQSGGSAF